MRKRLLALVFAALMATSLTACGSGNSTADSQGDDSQNNSASEQANSLEELLSALNDAVSDTEVGSTARADAIISQAKADAENPNESIGNEAASFIVSTYPEFYDSNETMEKVMYCGAYLEYADFGDTSTKIGMDTVQAVKYVYRGADTVEDTGTQENLRQIGEALSEAGLI